MYKRLLAILLVLTSLGAIAQEHHAYIKNLKAEAFGDRLLVSWTTKSGFSCQDINIELGKDSINFVKKATYFGICGDTNERNYSITVENPFLNAINYVRLDLGSFGYSYIVSEQVIYISGVAIVPLPVTESSVLYFENSAKEEYTIDIYDLNGRISESIITNGNSLALKDHIEVKGFYMYQISKNANVVYRAKFIY